MGNQSLNLLELIKVNFQNKLATFQNEIFVR